MKRDIEQDLLRWKKNPGRMPLLVRGARQVGKTYVVEEFGRRHFASCITINFELHPEYKQCFAKLEPTYIVNALSLILGVRIVPGKTLLFLDEIQDCPNAIMALRYFKEKLPALHIIGAGSLLEFTLNDKAFRMPVGRVEFLYLRPFSFGEFLDAIGHEELRTYRETISLGETVPEPIHNKLLQLVREYAAIGGMPAAILSYISARDLHRCQAIQHALLLGFRRDFGKYANRMPHDHLETIFTKAPGLIGRWLKYKTLHPDLATPTIKNALQKLCAAGLITLVYTTSAAGLPFISHRNEKKCKLLFLDIGLVKRACHLDIALLLEGDLLLINNGALAEQLVGQELLAYTGKEEMGELYSWAREAKSSSAEVDFLIHVGSQIVPIEVKAGKTGSLRSLKLLMEEKKLPLGVQISEKPLGKQGAILSIPLYLIEELPRLVKEVALGKRIEYDREHAISPR